MPLMSLHGYITISFVTPWGFLPHSAASDFFLSRKPLMSVLFPSPHSPHLSICALAVTGPRIESSRTVGARKFIMNLAHVCASFEFRRNHLWSAASAHALLDILRTWQRSRSSSAPTTMMLIGMLLGCSVLMRS